jgi:hypothetical protein
MGTEDQDGLPQEIHFVRISKLKIRREENPVSSPV